MRRILREKQLLNLSMVRHEATRDKTYSDGVDYYLDGNISSMEYYDDELKVVGAVEGRDEYYQTVIFEDRSFAEIKKFECTCPAYYLYPGLCKHLVAILLAFSNEGTVQKSFNENNIQPMKNIFRNDRLEALKRIIAPEIVLQDRKQVIIKPMIRREINRYGRQNPMEVTFMVREDGAREYKMQHISRFADSFMRKSSYEFAKKLIYNPKDHFLSETSKKLIEYIYERSLDGSYDYQSANRGEIFLNDRAAESFLRVLYRWGIPFDYEDGYVVIKNAIIEDENLELNVMIEKDKDDTRIKYNGERTKSMIPMVSSGSFLVYGNSANSEQKIWYVSDEKKSKYEFVRYMGENDGNVNLGKCRHEDIAVIVSNMNKVAKNFAIAKNLSDNIVKEDLIATAYLDKYEDGVSIKLEYVYGGERINPLATEKTEKIIMRDEKRETEIKMCVENVGFGVSDDIYILDNTDYIYDFISNDLEELKLKIDEIYYSDDFKMIKVNPKTSFKASTRMGDNNLLDITFDYGDIKKEEIRDILHAFKQKRKYHRLKDGSFVNLNDENILQMHEIIEDLDISDKKLLAEKITIPIFRLMYLDSKLKSLDNFILDKDKILSKLIKDIRTGTHIKHEVPAVVKGILREYQEEGYKWLKTLDNYNFGGILADDMGLGKTLQFISFLLSVNSEKQHPNLLITPTSIVYNWQSEIEKFANGKFKVGIISGNKSERRIVLENYREYDILITSYPLIRRDGHLYEEKTFEYVVLDEAQHIKNHTSITAKTTKILNAKRRFALTGTPIENNLLELWSIFDFILPGYLHSYNKFLTKYDRKIIHDNDKKTLENLNRHVAPFILRRLKKDVLKELPDKIETKMITELTIEQKKMYVAELSKAKKEISEEIQNEGFARSKIKILAILMRLRQICCHPAVFAEGYKGGSGKLELLNELVDEIVERNGKALIFSQFTSMLKIIQDELKKKGIEYLYLDGSVKSSERLNLVNEFNNGSIKIFLISLKAGGTGLNLTSADTVIHYDPWWNPAVETQATDRAHRIGQKNVVQVIKIITKGTIEEKIYEMQQKKKELIDSVIKEDTSPIVALSEKEIYSLFE
ncbi:MAG TPA: helicase [Clostridiales bacterium]|nr:MAG: hypothetical protein A2Y22_07920 [Clostridiales bacterium GWD2_32_59]HAN09140.1 helicase [Clostridiales bacterium]